MTTQATIFGKDGYALGDIQGTFNRQWSRNRWGEAKFLISVNEADPEMLEFGNLLVLEHDKLPDWVGYFDAPESWGDGKIQMTAYSAERLLQLRPGRVGQVLKGTAGVLFTQIIGVANAWADTLIRPGEIYEGGTNRQESLNLGDLYTDVTRIAKRSKMDWNVTPQVTGGKLTLLGNWYEQIGETIDFALEEGINIQNKSNQFEIQGEIWNAVIGYGRGATWNSRPITSLIVDEDSWNGNGPRIKGVYVDTDSLATVEAGARAFLKNNKQARTTLNVTALDAYETFEHLGIGNIYDMTTVKLGFQEQELGVSFEVQEQEMTFNEGSNNVDMVVDKIN